MEFVKNKTIELNNYNIIVDKTSHTKNIVDLFFILKELCYKEFAGFKEFNVFKYLNRLFSAEIEFKIGKFNASFMFEINLTDQNNSWRELEF